MGPGIISGSAILWFYTLAELEAGRDVQYAIASSALKSLKNITSSLPAQLWHWMHTVFLESFGSRTAESCAARTFVEKIAHSPKTCFE